MSRIDEIVKSRHERIKECLRTGAQIKIMTRSKSFSDRLKAGATKAELMQHYCISEEQYGKVTACLDRIQAAQGGK